MRDLQFQQRYGAANEQAILEIERVIGASLPDQYRAYLLNDGGGWTPEYAHFKVHFPESYPAERMGEWHWINEFYEWRHPPRTAGSVLETWERFQIQEPGDFGLPAEVLPIAATTGGICMVLLGIMGQWRGRLFFVHTNERPEYPDWSYIVPVANSFDAWLQSLAGMADVPAEYRF